MYEHMKMLLSYKYKNNKHKEDYLKNFTKAIDYEYSKREKDNHEDRHIQRQHKLCNQRSIDSSNQPS